MPLSISRAPLTYHCIHNKQNVCWTYVSSDSLSSKRLADTVQDLNCSKSAFCQGSILSVVLDTGRVALALGIVSSRSRYGSCVPSVCGSGEGVNGSAAILRRVLLLVFTGDSSLVLTLWEVGTAAWVCFECVPDAVSKVDKVDPMSISSSFSLFMPDFHLWLCSWSCSEC